MDFKMPTKMLLEKTRMLYSGSVGDPLLILPGMDFSPVRAYFKHSFSAPDAVCAFILP